MNIVFTHRSTVDRVGGVVTFIFELSDTFIRKGHDVTIVTFSSAINREAIKKLYSVENVPRIIGLKEHEPADLWPPRGNSLKDLSV